MQSSFRDRVVAGLGSAFVVALLGVALILGLTVPIQVRRDTTTTLLDFVSPPPPPPISKPRVEPARHSAAKAPAAPPNLKRNPTPVVVPPPIVLPPLVVPPIVSAPVAGTGSAASSGASDRRGPGTGAGGEGDGTGGGGDGDGEGGYVPPRQIHGSLKISDLTPDLRAAGVGGSVAVHYRVETDGHVTGCAVAHSSGKPDLDALTCQLIEQRFRFKPSLDPSGRPVRAIVEETHSWIFDKPQDAPEDAPRR